ncbi:hypothetical protein LC607_29125 [Nostoc sp. CHAB 5824]|nr:hypothetical protein [Nostoc sp. CHAB 5824]
MSTPQDWIIYLLEVPYLDVTLEYSLTLRYRGLATALLSATCTEFMLNSDS